YEHITMLGVAEQRAIGRRMLSLYPGVFRGRGLDVAVTYKVRTKQSADALLQGMEGYSGPVHFSRADSLDAVLRFYDLSPAYLKYKKSAAVKRGVDTVDSDPRTAAVATAVWSRLFTPVFWAGRAVAAERVFADELYDLYSLQFSLPGEIK